MASMASSEEEVQRVETEASAPEILSENAPSSRSAIRVAISYVAESERELSVTVGLSILALSYPPSFARCARVYRLCPV